MNNNRLLGLLLAIALVALGVLAYLYYERTRTIAKIDVPGISGEITKKGPAISQSGSQNLNEAHVYDIFGATAKIEYWVHD